MKLKEFNTETCVTTRAHTGVPCIGVNVKAGLFRLNPEAQQLVNLKDGDQVVFLQDEEDPANWYLEKVKEKGFVLRMKETSGKGLVFNNRAVAKEIAESVSFTGHSGKCLIAGEATEFKKRQLWGVITGTLLNK
jgi:hypothetical protein